MDSYSTIIFDEFLTFDKPFLFLEEHSASLHTYVGYFAFQPTTPIRSEIDFKLAGTQCNVMMSRLKPWIQLQSSKKKKTVLEDGSPNPETLRSTKPEAIMWTCTVSAPEMTIVLYDLIDSPLYHVSGLSLFYYCFWWLENHPFIQNILLCYIFTIPCLLTKPLSSICQLN